MKLVRVDFSVRKSGDWCTGSSVESSLNGGSSNECIEIDTSGRGEV